MLKATIFAMAGSTSDSENRFSFLVLTTALPYSARVTVTVDVLLIATAEGSTVSVRVLVASARSE